MPIRKYGRRDKSKPPTSAGGGNILTGRKTITSYAPDLVSIERAERAREEATRIPVERDRSW